MLVLLVVAGCPGRTIAPRTPGAAWLRDIRIEGNAAIEDDDLAPGLAIDRLRREGRPVDPYQLALDTRRIRAEYFRQGFFEAKVDSRIDHEGQAQIAVFEVTEGPRAMARVSVTGLPPELGADEVLARLPLRDGAPFDYELYDDGRDLVKAMVEDVGYPFVVDDSVVTVDRSAGVAAASYRLDTGPRATFGAVTIDGVEPDSDLYAAILGRLAFRSGELYSPAALAETSRSLYELGRFSQVRIEVERDHPSTEVPVKIGVTMAGRAEVRAGGGFGYEPLTYEARLRGGFSYIPADYPLQAFAFDARVAATVDHDFGNVEPKVRLLGSWQRLELLRPYIVGTVTTGIDYFTVEAYTAGGGLLSVGASAPLGRRWLTGQASWSLSYLSFSGISGLLDARDRRELGLAGDERHGRFEQSIVADLRDNPLEPRRGALLSLRVTEGTKYAGGAFTYLELQPELRGYLPLGSWVLAARLRYGVILGDVPITIRFFSGGAQNHRGFSARALAPSVAGFDDETGQFLGTVLVGGQAVLETGAELRIPLGELEGFLTGLTVFVDGGDVPFAPDQLDPLDLHWAAGVGVFAKYGGFKVRFDIGKRLNRLPVGVDGGVEDGLFQNINLFLAVGETY